MPTSTQLLTPSSQKQMLDHWSDELQSFLRTAIEQGGPAAKRMKKWLNDVHPLGWTVG